MHQWTIDMLTAYLPQLLDAREQISPAFDRFTETGEKGFFTDDVLNLVFQIHGFLSTLSQILSYPAPEQ
ncbi:hypothetical protein ACFLTX_01520 [Chloroflexota bacterium]